MSDSKSSGSIMGIDYGSVRVGVAISDPLQMIAQGTGTFANDRHLVGAIAGLCDERGVVAIVVGMPYSEDGGKGAKAQEVDRFIAMLSQQVSVPIETWDESLTSVEARDLLRRSGMRKKQRREKGRVDEMAARLLLQEYLDHLTNGRNAGD